MPRIYIANLAAYNAGKLIGLHADLDGTADMNLEDINNTIATLRTGDPACEEVAVHDYEGMPSMGEHPDFKKVATVAALINDDEDRTRAYIEAVGMHYVLADYDDALRAIEDAFVGAYGEEGEYAESMTDDHDVPDHIKLYIDYERMERDWEMGGDISRVTVDGTVFIFNNH